jgi:hypothetical protein
MWVDGREAGWGTARLISERMTEAAISIVLITAEGAGEFTPREKGRSFRVAPRRHSCERATRVDQVRKSAARQPTESPAQALALAQAQALALALS